MEIASRTPEGQPHDCPICGRRAHIETSQFPTKDCTCPHCGHLLWHQETKLQTIVLSRRPSESVVVNESINVTVASVRDEGIQLVIDGTDDVVLTSSTRGTSAVETPECHACEITLRADDEALIAGEVRVSAAPGKNRGGSDRGRLQFTFPHYATVWRSEVSDAILRERE